MWGNADNQANSCVHLSAANERFGFTDCCWTGLVSCPESYVWTAWAAAVGRGSRHDGPRSDSAVAGAGTLSPSHHLLNLVWSQSFPMTTAARRAEHSQLPVGAEGQGVIRFSNEKVPCYFLEQESAFSFCVNSWCAQRRTRLQGVSLTVQTVLRVKAVTFQRRFAVVYASPQRICVE